MFEVVSVLFILTALALTLGRWHESRSLFVPSREHEDSPEKYSLQPEEVWLTAGGAGEKIHGWYFGGSPDGAVILYIHGNAGTIADRLPAIRGYVENGHNVFIYDYRGFGKSGGKPGVKNFIQDTFTAYDYLIGTRGVQPSDIVLLGQSLGGSAALKLANGRKCRAVILEGTFYSIRQMARDIYPVIPIWLLASSYLDNGREIKKLEAAVLLIHGGDDEVISPRHSEMLFQAAHQPKKLLVVKGSSHTEMYLTDKELYYGTIKRFIKSSLIHG